MQAIKKAAHERAADENNLQDHNTMPAQVVQAVETVKAGLESLKQIVNLIMIYSDVGVHNISVQVDSEQDMDHLPGQAVITSRGCSEYPYKMSKDVLGVEFFTILEEDPNAAR
jgi:hypothetical protein